MEKKVKSSNKNQGNKKPKAKVRVFKKKNKGLSEKEQIDKLKEQYEVIDLANVNLFTDFPLSKSTLRGLKENHYKVPTDIQKETIGLSLQGKDVLGAAKTGSGKTLAFLIPVLEILYCRQWSAIDGLGALIITPTRELAYQIFETLRKVGVYHDFSAGLIIGGKDLKFETKRMDQCNIVIGTPGRILQHMDENPLFDCCNMQVVVLDEADRCLDMGFQVTMNAIIANLPPQRQTLLFSATQTKSVKDLARLSLTHPSFISVHENAKHSTPENLHQTYTVCELHEKLSVLWSFIRNHLKQKMIIFLSTCKQVKYVYEVFCRLRPGMSLMALYGTLHQLRRMSIYEDFCGKQTAVLFATDLASRGLDFPKVDWVVQVDCPEDAETYIHRVGRTARFNRGGQSFMILLPSEEPPMLELLEQKKIPIDKIDVNPTKLQNPVRKMEAFLARDPSLKATAQRAFVAYAKSVFLMKNKQVFNLQSLDTDAFAHSLGLAVAPRIRFLERHNKALKEKPSKKESSKTKTVQNNNITKFDTDDDINEEIKSESEDDINDEINSQLNDEIKEEIKSESDDESCDDSRNFKPERSAFDVSDSETEENGLFTLKRQDHDIEDPLSDSEIVDFTRQPKNKKAITKAALAKKILKKNILPNKKIMFDEEGEKVYNEKEKRSELAQNYENADEGGIDIEAAKLVLKEEDKFDKERFREKIKAKHKEQKRKLKEQKRRDQEENDEFGGQSEDEEPDLSWMPDPDKIYGEKKYDDGESDQEFFKEEPEKSEIDLPKETNNKPKKRKTKPDPSPPKTPAKKRKSALEDVSSLTVNEAEELAMMLLKNK